MAETAAERGVVSYKARDSQEIKLSLDVVKKYLVQGRGEFVNEQEAMFFMGICKSRGLNPFKKDCYLIKYAERDPAAIVVSIDYFRSRARAQPDCVGWQNGIVVQSIKGDIVERAGALIYEGEKLLGGWFKAKPKGWEIEYYWAIPLAPYIKKRADGQVTKFWAEENQPMQIAKVAESQGLRHVWTDEFQNLYVEEEITHEAKDITPQREMPKLKPIGGAAVIEERRKPAAPAANVDEQQRRAEPKRAEEHEPAETSETSREPSFDPTPSEPIDEPSQAHDEPRPQTLTNLQQALEWVKTLKAGQFDTKTLTAKMKELNLNIKEQVSVCTAFTERKKEV